MINGKEVLVPIKTYVYFHFKDWLSSLLSRPGIEGKLDAAWDRSETTELRDVFDGATLKGFPGPDGRLFLDGGDEGRYAFSLCCDFFNSLGNKKAGKSQSLGMIALVCLNLPPDLRYKPENMFLAGVVPGPQEPPLDCLNQYFSPLVTEFLEFWETPVRFTRTHAYPGGRCVRCALLLVVCDLPAARKVAGYASFVHTSFCAMCRCRRDKEGYVGVPYAEWERRTNEEYREAAHTYNTAANSNARDGLVKANGFRCSELLRLPYFDPARFVVIDAMHNLFLGLVHEHCSGLLGLGKRRVAAPVISITLPPVWPDLTTVEQKSVAKIHDKLEGPLCEKISQDREGVYTSLMARHLRALTFVAKTVGVYPTALQPRSITKDMLVDALIDWRALQQEIDPPTLHDAFLRELRMDIAATKVPSWVESVPHNLGEAGHGKLKASQWRSLGLVYMPASLIRIWGETNDEDTHPLRRRNRRALHVTLSLLSAISIATSNSTSTTSARGYCRDCVQLHCNYNQVCPQSP
jgi:Transposase family tnp2